MSSDRFHKLFSDTFSPCRSTEPVYRPQRAQLASAPLCSTSSISASSQFPTKCYQQCRKLKRQIYCYFVLKFVLSFSIFNNCNVVYVWPCCMPAVFSIEISNICFRGSWILRIVLIQITGAGMQLLMQELSGIVDIVWSKWINCVCFESNVMISTPFVFVNCASISALFEILYLMFYSTYQRATPLSAAASPYSSSSVCT